MNIAPITTSPNKIATLQPAFAYLWAGTIQQKVSYGSFGYNADVIYPGKNNVGTCMHWVTGVISLDDLISFTVANKSQYPDTYDALIQERNCDYKSGTDCFQLSGNSWLTGSSNICGIDPGTSLAGKVGSSSDLAVCPSEATLHLTICTAIDGDMVNGDPNRHFYSALNQCYKKDGLTYVQKSDSAMTSGLSSVSALELIPIEKELYSKSTIIDVSYTDSSPLFGVPFSVSQIPHTSFNNMSGSSVAPSAVQQAVTDTFMNPEIKQLLESRFPYAYLSQAYDYFILFVHEPVAPQIPIKIGEEHVYTLDFSPFDTLATFFRWLLLVYLMCVASLAARNHFFQVTGNSGD